MVNGIPFYPVLMGFKQETGKVVDLVGVGMGIMGILGGMEGSSEKKVYLAA